MKEFLDKTFYGNTIEQWGIALLYIMAAIVLGKILYWLFKNVVKKFTAKTKTKLDDILVDMIEEPIVMAIALVGFWMGLSELNFGDGVTDFIFKAFYAAVTINVTWFIARLLDALIEEYVVPLTAKTESDFDDQILPVVRKGLRSIIWILGIIVALNNAGYDVGALIAGLGIGGLALAMAAKDSVSNIFGGIMVFTDKPFKVGDRIKIGGFDGTITEIGLRSSRMKTLEGRMVTIPNATFTGSMVENVSSEPSRKVVLNLGLVYDSTPDQVQLALTLLRNIAAQNNDIEENVSLSFNAFNDSSLGILFVYYIKKESDILQTQTDINLAIHGSFVDKGLEMAFPTQTIFTKAEA